MFVSDEVLVKKYLAGDSSAFEEIVSRYEKKVYTLAYRITGNKDDASDILQDSFLQVLRKLRMFKGESKFSTWFYRIVVNLCLMRKRKEKRLKTVSLDVPTLGQEKEELRRELLEDWSENPLATIENAELKRTLSEAIDSLPTDYRAVFILRNLQDLSNKEVAKILKISLPAVKSRLHRARLFLRSKLSNYFKELETKNV